MLGFDSMQLTHHYTIPLQHGFTLGMAVELQIECGGATRSIADRHPANPVKHYTEHSITSIIFGG